LSQGAAENICGRLRAAKVTCEIVRFPYVAEAPNALPTPSVASGDSPPGVPVLDVSNEGAATSTVMVDLGRYPSAERANVAWSLLRRLYAPDLAGAARQNTGDEAMLVVGPLPHSQSEALCETLGQSVPRCELQPIPSNSPVAVLAPAPTPNQSPTLQPLRPVRPAVPAEPVPAVETEPLPSETTEDARAGPPGTETTVVAVRLGEYGSQTGVDAGWQVMRRLYPEVLRRAQQLESAEPPGERRPLLVGPFSELDALSVCARLIADGQSCRVTRARL
jgi:hypothetical protein